MTSSLKHIRDAVVIAVHLGVHLRPHRALSSGDSRSSFSSFPRPLWPTQSFHVWNEQRVNPQDAHGLCLPSFLPGIYKGHCFRINHFPEDNDYDHDSSEYLLRECQVPPAALYQEGRGREGLER